MKQTCMHIHNLFKFFLNLFLIILCLNRLPSFLIINFFLKLLQFRLYFILVRQRWFTGLNKWRLASRHLILWYFHFLSLPFKFKWLHSSRSNSLKLWWSLLRANTFLIIYCQILGWWCLWWQSRLLLFDLSQSIDSGFLKRLWFNLLFVLFGIVSILNFFRLLLLLLR